MTDTKIATVAVLGTGVLGAQIAFQTAYRGFPVTAYDISDDALSAARERFTRLGHTYAAEVPGATPETIAAAHARLQLTTDLAVAAQADLVIEAIPEILDLKRSTFEKLGALAPASTIFATNSSTLLPSQIGDASGRPDRFLALHFANRVWQFNTAEVMGTPETDPDVFAEVVRFAGDIGMVPIELRKEKAGYVLNSLLVPLLNSAIALAADGYADVDDIDRTWRIATGAPMGPLQILDVIGLTTPYNILTHGSGADAKLAEWLKETTSTKAGWAWRPGRASTRTPELRRHLRVHRRSAGPCHGMPRPRTRPAPRHPVECPVGGASQDAPAPNDFP